MVGRIRLSQASFMYKEIVWEFYNLLTLWLWIKIFLVNAPCSFQIWPADNITWFISWSCLSFFINYLITNCTCFQKCQVVYKSMLSLHYYDDISHHCLALFSSGISMALIKIWNLCRCMHFLNFTVYIQRQHFLTYYFCLVNIGKDLYPKG